MSSCPCCSYPLLRHIRHSQVDWFCQHCWQFMPDFSAPLTSSQTLSHFHNEVDVITTQPRWNREPNRHPQLVNLSDSMQFKNAKPNAEKTHPLPSAKPQLLNSEKTQRLNAQKARLLVGTREIL
ncbi:hypothetical protein NG796_23360 [Laspinema sp. A4]|uniref:hypothetical protein n=1 Tax=Laspinema sp. D2d TaxID=2953686 RepID=UPI0021BAC4DD|nr:hypothetical protein [Laspinema sp. D2d]MCT7986216.1 hypothetical protein [Laspinema sp. D2d]